eukprot:gene6376-4601_t
MLLFFFIIIIIPSLLVINLSPLEWCVERVAQLKDRKSRGFGKKTTEN